jgi:hypothetical protein
MDFNWKQNNLCGITETYRDVYMERNYFVSVRTSGGLLAHGNEILGFIRGEGYLLIKDC